MTGAEKAHGDHGKVTTVSTSTAEEIRFKTRRTVVDAIVFPGDTEVLLGAIPLGDLDVILVPLKETIELPPDRPTIARTKVKSSGLQPHRFPAQDLKEPQPTCFSES